MKGSPSPGAARRGTSCRVSVLMGYRVEQGLSATARVSFSLWWSFAVPLGGVAVVGTQPGCSGTCWDLCCCGTGTCLQLLYSQRQVEVGTGMGHVGV